MDWKQATFKIPQSWRDHVNKKASEWGCDAGSIWMAAIDAFFRDEDARTASIRFMLALNLKREEFEDVLPGDAHTLTEEWVLPAKDTTDPDKRGRKRPKRPRNEP